MKSINRQKFPLWALCAIVSGTVLLGGNSYAQYSSDEADAVMNVYNDAFYVSFGSGCAHFLNNQDRTSGASYFWTQAEIIEGEIDACDRNSGYQSAVTALLNGFSSDNGTDWSSNIYNDDVCWACIAYLRGYQATGDTTFRTIAKANYDMIYARAWDTTLGGGLWWTTDKGGKNACVNGPGAIAAYLLYTTLGDSTYLTKAQNIYNWEMATLFNTNNGAIYDSISSAGSINTWASTYNQGTFVGAANYLGDVASATLAANYMLGSRGLLPDYGIGGNNSGFNGIGMRWVAKFMNDRNLQNNYLAALQFNANTAYMNRRSDGLSWCSWEYPTPSGNLDSWSCISSVVAMQVVPPTFPYTWVTNENGTVNFSTPVDAAFGANGSDFFKYGVAGSIAFNTATFGDPIYGVAKSGYATAFTNCAVENGSYTFTVPVTAAYGAQGKYNYNPCVSGTVAFNNATFNDPISGVAKAGYYMPYTLCAIEGQSNTFTSPTYVAFGVNGHYYFKTNVTGTITFNTTTFRDPDVGVAKFGYYRSVTTAPVVGISNASFETPSVGTGYWYNPPGGNWTFDSDSGIQANSSAWGAPTAPDGTQTAFVQISNGTNNGSLWQMAYCTAGTHTLSFKAALRSINNGAITLNVLVDGTVVGTYSPTTTTSFTSYTTSSFTTTLANHKIQFTAVGTTAVDATIFIDVVSIQ